MYIHEIKIAKFRHIENITIGPFKLNSKSSEVFAFAGPNGGGKSSIIELIAYALSDSYNLGFNANRTFEGFSFEIAVGLTSDEVKLVVESLNSEIETTLNELVSQKKQFENDQNKLYHHANLDNNYNQRINFIKQVIDYLNLNNIYYRSFKYVGGEYEKNEPVYARIHVLLVSILINKLKRPLGFLLKADRSYPQKEFQKEKIFHYSHTLNYDHLKSLAFTTSEVQYQGMYDFLVQQRYHYLRKLGSHHSNIEKGGNPTEKPSDPLSEYENLLQKLFPEYSFVEKEEDVPSNLFIKLPSNEIIPFNDLSSGEKEVFFILSFFIRHNVQNAVIMIDEPELHLHPELARLLIRNIQQIKNGNQIWLATHNSEIIDETGRDRVMYISKDPKTSKAKIVYGTDEDSSVNELKSLFGFSGSIGVAKNLVFLEGDNSSADRKFFTTLITASANIKFIPSNGSGNMSGINAAILSILESNLGWMNFYLIRDKDYLTNEMIEKYRNHKSGKIFVLKKHEIENYLLIPQVISTVLTDIFGIVKTQIEVKDLLFKTAIDISASVLRDMISFRANLLLQPEDFSMGKFLNNESIFDNELKINTETHLKLKNKFLNTSEEIENELKKIFDQTNLSNIIAKCTEELKSAIETDEWLSLYPGKELLETFCKTLKISSIALQNNLIKELSMQQNLLAVDLKEIFKQIQ